MLRSSLFVVALAVSMPATAADGVALTIAKGPTPGVLTLSWGGGVAPFQAYASPNPTSITNPGNLLGTSSSSPIQVPQGIDAVLYFLITTNCTPDPPEICNGEDDDCDGTVDNHLTPVFGICSPHGVCAAQVIPIYCGGTAGWRCNYNNVPNIELDGSGNLRATEARCDLRDGNCNGISDLDGFGNLGQPCSVGFGPCQRNGTTVCDPNQFSTRCNAIAGTPGTETCNGIDDDCDGTVDNHLTPPAGLCSTLGVCAGHTIPVVCNGSQGWKCNYTAVPNVELDGSGNLLATELRCDARDGNCNGTTDIDGFISLGLPCSVGIGACRRTGTTICASNQASTRCSVVAGSPTAETCNGIDDDCDGTVDEGCP